MKINVIFGFLGSGKTTLLRRILSERGRGGSLAVIVNEFGDVGVDGAILHGDSVDIVELSSGCLCCMPRGSVLNAVEELRDRTGVGHVVIEASGVADPQDTLDAFASGLADGTIEMGPPVCVVDAPRFGQMSEMLGEFYTEQAAHADIVLLNKIDLAGTHDLDAVARQVAAISPSASLLFTERCDIDVGLMLDAEARARASPRQRHQHEHGHRQFESLVLDMAGGASRARIEACFTGLDANVLRAKGHMMVDGRVCLVQYAGGRLQIEPADGRDGGRLVVIGRNLDRAAMAARFAFAGAPALAATARGAGKP